jgi:hypothetical protein
MQSQFLVTGFLACNGQSQAFRKLKAPIGKGSYISAAYRPDCVSTNTLVNAVTMKIATAKIADAIQCTPLTLLQLAHRASPNSRLVTGSERFEHAGQIL